jgi:hypothetical protein
MDRAASSSRHQSARARASSSRDHLLTQISSSTPWHLRGTPQEDFDCAWRPLAYEFAPVLQPWLNSTQLRQLYDALELGPKCNVTTREHEPERAVAKRITAPLGAGSVSFYVSASAGSDDNAGTLDQPFATLAHAVAAARRSRALSTKAAATIHVRAGTYYLDAPIVLTERDSGLTISAYQGEHAVVSGGVRLSGLDWQRQPSRAADAPVVYAADLSSHQLPRGMPALLHRGQRAVLARYPNANPEVGARGDQI